jgi:hypothetical protein
VKKKNKEKKKKKQHEGKPLGPLTLMPSGRKGETRTGKMPSPRHRHGAVTQWP